MIAKWRVPAEVSWPAKRNMKEFAIISLEVRMPSGMDWLFFGWGMLLAFSEALMRGATAG